MRSIILSPFANESYCPEGCNNFQAQRTRKYWLHNSNLSVGLVCQSVHTSHYLLLPVSCWRTYLCTNCSWYYRSINPSLPKDCPSYKTISSASQHPSVLGKLGWLVTLLNFLPAMVNAVGQSCITVLEWWSKAGITFLQNHNMHDYLGDNWLTHKGAVAF